jgi:hypothetical protein
MPIVTMPARRAKSRRLRWFILGIAFGAVTALFARGEASDTLHDLRVWSAKALRSLERTAPPPNKAKPSTGTPAVKPVAATVDAPCPMNPAPGDPCAELLAPFLDPPKPPVPTVSIDSLPRVKPVAIARRHHRGAPAAAPAASVADDPQEPPAEDEQDVATPRPQSPKPYDTAEVPTIQITTAANDPPVR